MDGEGVVPTNMSVTRIPNPGVRKVRIMSAGQICKVRQMTYLRACSSNDELTVSVSRAYDGEGKMA